jgi:hypothetical protein
MNGLQLALERLLRHPETITDPSRERQTDRHLFFATVLSILIGAGLFGMALATSRGGLQLLYSSIKMPIVCLITLAFVTPALAAVSDVFHRTLTLANAAVLMLTAAARASLILLALAPIVWLAFDHGLSYHRGVIVACFCYGIAGLEALRIIKLAFGNSARSFAIISVFSLVLLPAGAQTAWLLRPYLGRPSQTEVPFLRGKESSFNQSVSRSLTSSVEYSE